MVETHAAALERTQRTVAAAELAWLRHGQVEPAAVEAIDNLLSPEGRERCAQAVHDREYAAQCLPLLARQLDQLAWWRGMLQLRPRQKQWLSTKIVVGSGAQAPAALLAQLLREGPLQPMAAARKQALADALLAIAPYWLQGRASADEAAQTCSAALSGLWASPGPQPAVTGADGGPPGELALGPRACAAPTFAPQDPQTRASAWLAATDDAARELLPWLLRTAADGGGSRDWLSLGAALRAPMFDGLCRPPGRFMRVSEVARRLGFERDMTTRMRAETSAVTLAPTPRVVALAAPSDVRVAQPGLEYGLLSELAAAQGVGWALGLALASPALPAGLRWPVGVDFGRVCGELLLQLRADPLHLTRSLGYDRALAERVGRHVGVYLLLRTRLLAALLSVEREAAVSQRELHSQLMEAGQRALGIELPFGLLALAYATRARAGADFVAADCGLAVHAALRERFDEDWFRNPRVSDVLRGAAARGNLLDESTLRGELAAGAALGPARVLQLLG